MFNVDMVFQNLYCEKSNFNKFSILLLIVTNLHILLFFVYI